MSGARNNYHASIARIQHVSKIEAAGPIVRTRRLAHRCAIVSLAPRYD